MLAEEVQPIAAHRFPKAWMICVTAALLPNVDSHSSKLGAIYLRYLGPLPTPLARSDDVSI
jgi:hypothetical protein